MPVITLDKKHYKTVQQLNTLGMPSLKHCTSLKVVGKVEFAQGVEIHGKVEVVNHASELIAKVPAGVYKDTVYELNRHLKR